MNINQAQQLSGVSSDNIRFYEKQGLLCPRRNRANDYREYSEDDIRTLKLIRILRMLDMPLPQIRTVLAGDVPLSQAAQLQRQRLTLQAQQLESAILWKRWMWTVFSIEWTPPNRQRGSSGAGFRITAGWPCPSMKNGLPLSLMRR